MAAVMDNTIPIVGREEEMETALAMPSRTTSGHDGLLFAEGEAGIGKTGLVDEVIMTAKNLGFDDIVSSQTSGPFAVYGSRPLPHESHV
jgi:hypothetical protein